MPVSFMPETFSGGSLVDDVDATIARAVYTAHNWGKDDKPHQCVAALTLNVESDGDDPFEHVEYFYVANLDQFAPFDGENFTDLQSDDEDDWQGSHIEKVPSDTNKYETLWKGSPWAHFVRSAFQTEFPTPDDPNNISAAFEGQRFHFNRLPVPGRQNQVREDGKPPIHPLVPTVYLGAADAKPKGTKKGTKATASKKSASTTATASPAADDDFQSEVAAVIINLLTENDGEMAKVDLGRAVMGSFDDPKQKAAAFGIATKSGDGWTVDGKTVSLG